jgi:PAS domain S-box-containing protein
MPSEQVKNPDDTTPEQSGAELRFMAESMPQMIFVARPDGSIAYVSPQWEEYSGIPLQELLGSNWTQILHPDEYQSVADTWQHSMKTGEPLSVEHRMRRKDGVYRWHISQARARRGNNGKILGWYGSCTDIDDSKKSLSREHALTVEREKLLELNASKDEFISLASHQLRTPATAVKQYLNMVLDGYAGKLTPKLEDMIEKANGSNDRQIDIVDDLLRVARVDAGKVKLIKSVTNLVPLVQEVVNEYGNLLEERNQEVHIVYKQPSISALIDPFRMRMVIENLLDNASKYSVDGKDITITITKHAEAVTIAIKDEGFGIAKDEIPRLFHKFSRLDNPLSVTVGGTGLGLYWAKRIVSLHGGNIEVKSKPGEGSIFTIVLPGKKVSI